MGSGLAFREFCVHIWYARSNQSSSAPTAGSSQRFEKVARSKGCHRYRGRFLSSGQKSSNGKEEADLPGRCRWSARCVQEGHENARLVIMVMSGQRSVEQPEGRRPARRTPSRQESAESQQNRGGQKGVDFEEPNTLLGTALSSQDGNE